MSNISANQSGFSLVQLSIIIAVVSMIAVATLPGGDKDNNRAKILTTAQKLDKIEEAMEGFKAAYGRLPCPADATLDFDAANFGKEAANAGTCTGGVPAATFGPSSEVVAGMIPLRALQLPDEYAYDAYNNRFTYVADRTVTDTAACQVAYKNKKDGNVIISNGAATPTTQPAMYAFISHGENGHGAFTIRGGAIANRNNLLSADTSEQENASVNAMFATTFNPTFVAKENATTYDDITRFSNTCCSGAICTPAYDGPEFFFGANAPRLSSYTLNRTTNVLSQGISVSPAPFNSVRGVAIDKSNTYVAGSLSSAASGIEFFKRSGMILTRLPDPSGGMPGLNANLIAMSRDGTYVAVTDDNPHVWIYKRSGDSFTRLTGSSGPQTTSTLGFGIAFSPDGTYLATGKIAAPRLYIYKRTGDRFDKIADPAVLPSTQPPAMDFSEDSTYLAVTGSMGDAFNLYIYKRSGDVFTHLTGANGPQTQPATPGPYALDFSPDGTYLVTNNGLFAAGIVVYKRTGDRFDKIVTGPNTNGTDVNVAGQIFAAKFTIDGNYLVVGSNAAPYIFVYKRSGDSFTMLPAPGVAPTGTVMDIAPRF